MLETPCHGRLSGESQADASLDPVVMESIAQVSAALHLPEPRGMAFGRLRLLSLADAEMAPPRTYLLDKLLAPGELSLWWGAPKSGKSFLVLRLAYGLALGQGMWGKSAPRPLRILYVAAEGESGFAGRLLAVRDELGDVGDAFAYVAQRVVVGPPGDDLSDLIAAARFMRTDLIVLDTVARTYGAGEENSSKDMGAYVAAADFIREATGAHVALVHHGRRDGLNSRGSSALDAAADLIVKVAKIPEGGGNVATVEAAKDDEDGGILPFRLRLVELPPGPHGGEPRLTCVAVEGEDGAGRAGPPGKRLSPQARAAMHFLADLCVREGQPLPVGSGWPSPSAGLYGVPESRWREECESRRLSTGDTERNRTRAFNKEASKLRDGGQVAFRDGWVWLTKPEPAV